MDFQRRCANIVWWSPNIDCDVSNVGVYIDIHLIAGSKNIDIGISVVCIGASILSFNVGAANSDSYIINAGAAIVENAAGTLIQIGVDSFVGVGRENMRTVT